MTTAELQDLVRARELAASGGARVIRETNGLSLHEVGQVVGVAPSTVLRWERGNHRPRGRAAVQWVRLMRELPVAMPDAVT